MRRSQTFVNSLKEMLLQLFLYFSVQIETENYKLIFESQFRIFIKWGKICITFGTFYDELWDSTPKGKKKFQLFLTSACESEEYLKTVPSNVYTFWEISQYYIFISFEIGTKNRKSFLT